MQRTPSKAESGILIGSRQFGKACYDTIASAQAQGKEVSREIDPPPLLVTVRAGRDNRDLLSVLEDSTAGSGVLRAEKATGHQAEYNSWPHAAGEPPSFAGPKTAPVRAQQQAREQ